MVIAPDSMASARAHTAGPDNPDTASFPGFVELELPVSPGT